MRRWGAGTWRMRGAVLAVAVAAAAGLGACGDDGDSGASGSGASSAVSSASGSGESGSSTGTPGSSSSGDATSTPGPTTTAAPQQPTTGEALAVAFVRAVMERGDVDRYVRDPSVAQRARELLADVDYGGPYEIAMDSDIAAPGGSAGECAVVGDVTAACLVRIDRPGSNSDDHVTVVTVYVSDVDTAKMPEQAISVPLHVTDWQAAGE